MNLLKVAKEQDRQKKKYHAPLLLLTGAHRPEEENEVLGQERDTMQEAIKNNEHITFYTFNISRWCEFDRGKSS
ncbi:hypothetical protein JYU34_004531 [Plutella xylostella]|uniref:Uncharacterized protein n=1 Tax=Plutella xylostella TaxID=51655 RepID=A0ABQ7QY79_PLUXY|nr:hypothetical protein JYU34_004531 [Plutella xylostella]